MVGYQYRVRLSSTVAIFVEVDHGENKTSIFIHAYEGKPYEAELVDLLKVNHMNAVVLDLNKLYNKLLNRQNFWRGNRYLVSYQIIFTLRKSVPSKNWRGKGFGGVTDGKVDDLYCTDIFSEVISV